MKAFYIVGMCLVSLSCFQIKNVSAQSSENRNTASTTVQSFYKFHRARPNIFNRRQVEARKRWFSRNLYGLFVNELWLEKEYLKKYPTDKPYFGDGFPFQPYDECSKNDKGYPNVYKLGTTSVKGNKATVEVGFYNPKQCGGDKLETYKVELLKVKGKWLIDDWVYSDSSRLSADLKKEHY